MELKIRAPVRRLGDDIDTDAIIPARYLNITETSALGRHCLEDEAPGFSARVKKGDILVAGRNFGCGSSREHAPLALVGCGISCVVALSFSRLFYRNAINIGLPLITLEASGEIAEGDTLEIDYADGLVKNVSSGKEYSVETIPGFMMEILSGGGLVSYLEKRLDSRQ